jgi:hypothetical protein
MVKNTKKGDVVTRFWYTLKYFHPYDWICDQYSNHKGQKRLVALKLLWTRCLGQ